MQLDTCGLIGRCMQQFSQLSCFCSSSCWQFFTVLFLGCLGTFWDVLECFGMSWNVMHLIWTKVWWWSNDGAAKGHEKDGKAIWKTLQLRIVTCWFVACPWNLVLGVSGTWTVMDSYWNLLSWSFGSSVWHSLHPSVLLRAMWVFDVLVVLLLVLLCVLLWMGWQFKKYTVKLRDQETRFRSQENRLAELECLVTTGPLDTTTSSTKKTVRSGVQTEWNQMCFYMRPHSRVLHREECQYLQGPGVKELHLCQICFQR